MAFDAFLKLDGIDGESVAKGYEKWIEVSSFSWGCVDIPSTNTGGGAGAGKVQLSDLNFVTNFSKASPALLRACATGEHIKEAQLQVRKAGDRAGAFYKVKFEDILVSSYQTGGSSDAFPTESISLNYARLSFDEGSSNGT